MLLERGDFLLGEGDVQGGHGGGQMVGPGDADDGSVDDVCFSTQASAMAAMEGCVPQACEVGMIHSSATDERRGRVTM